MWVWEVRALFPIVKDGLRATLLNSVLSGFTAYNTTVTNLLLAKLVEKSGGNPAVDVDKFYKASKDIIYRISGDLMEIAEEHLTRKEVEDLHGYIQTLKEITK